MGIGMVMEEIVDGDAYFGVAHGRMFGKGDGGVDAEAGVGDGGFGQVECAFLGIVKGVFGGMVDGSGWEVRVLAASREVGVFIAA